MAASSLTLELIYRYFKENGNVVKNRELVHYFKDYLTDPQTKEDARVKFKKYVNMLAQTKTENNEKYLMLKTKYLHSLDILKTTPYASPQHDPLNSVGIPSYSGSNSDYYHTSPQYPGGHHRQPPPYRPPPPVSSPSCSDDNISISSNFSQDFCTPQPPPRRKSSADKMRAPLEELQNIERNNRNEEEEPEGGEEKLTLSVKERRDKFNRLASHEEESNSPRTPKNAERSRHDKGVDQDDGASIASLEPKKCMEWCVTASKGDCQELLKLAKDEPRLVNRKDPFTTVLHWGAKHGNAEMIKVFAGTYKVDVNGRTGYTPLHMAAQFGHKDIFKLLIEVYKADIKIRDYSGHTPEYYLKSREHNKGRKDTIRKLKSRKKQTDKDLGFLRIGSLNVRVKKTTEAFSNFLGVGGNVTPLETMLEKPQKGWGSAENLNQKNNCDTFVSYAKKKSKRPNSTGVSSIPGTPQQRIRGTYPKSLGSNDSDSDSAAGFDNQWKN